MKIHAIHIHDYFQKIPDERKKSVKKLYETISDNLPKGFEEAISYGMIAWNVPLSMYPSGYHCTPGKALPFFSIASQKNSVNLYHMGMYADKNLYDWFVAEYPKYSKRKLDMGKSCVRFKKPEEIPFELIAELARKITPEDWVELYEKMYKKQTRG